MELNDAQKATRAEGMKHGVPEEFAIDCKARVYGNLTVGDKKYKPNDSIVIHDSRKRDKFRQRQLIAVVDDAFLDVSKPVTIKSGSKVQPDSKETSNDNAQAAPATDPQAAKRSTRAVPKAAAKRTGRSGAGR